MEPFSAARSRGTNLLRITVLASALLLPISGSAYRYEIQPGDTISEVLQRLFGSPLYGPRGRVLSTIKKNPHILDPNLVFPGNTIEIPGFEEKEPDPQIKPTLAEPPSPVPVSSETPFVSPEFVPSSRFSALAEFSQVRIDGTDLGTRYEATANSGLGTGLVLEWARGWTSAFESSLRIRSRQMTLSGLGSKTYSGLQAGVSRNFLNGARLGLSAGIQQEPYLTSISRTSATLDSIALPRVNAHLGYAWKTTGPYTPSVDFSYGLLFPVSKNGSAFKQGSEWSGSVSVLRGTSSFQLSSRLYYSTAKQSTSSFEVDRTDIGLQFGIAWTSSPERR